MEIFLYFMSGLTLGIAMTHTYYDAKARRERMDAMFAKVKVMGNNSNNNSNESIQ
jgi:hypothetical protein